MKVIDYENFTYRFMTKASEYWHLVEENKRLIDFDKKIDLIYLALKGKPKSHQEWANSFNIKHKIKQIFLL